MSDRPFDPGLQPERSLLSWRRTALALALVSAVGAHLTVGQSGVIAVIGGAIGVAVSVLAYIGAAKRYRRIHTSLSESTSVMGVSSWPLLLVALGTVLLSMWSMSYVVLGWGSRG